MDNDVANLPGASTDPVDWAAPGGKRGPNSGVADEDHKQVLLGGAVADAPTTSELVKQQSGCVVHHRPCCSAVLPQERLGSNPVPTFLPVLWSEHDPPGVSVHVSTEGCTGGRDVVFPGKPGQRIADETSHLGWSRPFILAPVVVKPLEDLATCGGHNSDQLGGLNIDADCDGALRTLVGDKSDAGTPG
jgi:hypothetical protein